MLEEKVVLAEFELASLRAQVTGDRARDAGVVTPSAPTPRTPLSPVARSPTLAAEARAASRVAPTGVENAVEKARSPAQAPRESAPAATPPVNPPFPTKDSATGATTPKVIVVPTQPRTVMGSDESPQPTEWVEEVEPGVFLTIARHHSSAANVLRRVRFSKTKFSDGNAQAWWERNRVRIIRARGLKLVRPAS